MTLWLSLWSLPYSAEKNASYYLSPQQVRVFQELQKPGQSSVGPSLSLQVHMTQPRGLPATMPYCDTEIQEGNWNQALSKFDAQSHIETPSIAAVKAKEEGQTSKAVASP